MTAGLVAEPHARATRSLNMLKGPSQLIRQIRLHAATPPVTWGQPAVPLLSLEERGYLSAYVDSELPGPRRPHFAESRNLFNSPRPTAEI